MPISHYLKEIGRGKDGARALSREQAADLFGQVLDGAVTDLEIGAFCLAMRVKGETAPEMAGFLDATDLRLQKISMRPTRSLSSPPTVVIPSYNGARKMPLLTPLLALLLAREGLPVLIHGVATESTRLYTSKVLQSLMESGHTAIKTIVNRNESIAPGEVAFVPTSVLCQGLQRLLDVRRVVGLRNSAHSVVKLMNPCAGPAFLVTSFTHPEYALSMAATLTLRQAHAMLVRGTEGEAVADARRTPQMLGFFTGQQRLLQEAQTGTLPEALPQGALWPQSLSLESTTAYILAVMQGRAPVPTPIALQVERILHALPAQ